MRSQEKSLSPCDPKIFKKGQSVAALDAGANEAEEWVRAVAKEADARVDWHYSGGMAHVLHLGNKKSRDRVEATINKLESTLKGRILRRYQTGEAGLYRQGVTRVPKGTVASFMDPFTGNAVFMVKDKKK